MRNRNALAILIIGMGSLLLGIGLLVNVSPIMAASLAGSQRAERGTRRHCRSQQIRDIARTVCHRS
jgi:hypothetical protein